MALIQLYNSIEYAFCHTTKKDIFQEKKNERVR